MSPTRGATRELLDLAAGAADLGSWRREALAILRRCVPFDVALFHELSPRAPLERAALVGIDGHLLAASSGRWDDDAVALGRLRDVAMAQGGVASDADAFPPRSRARREWEQRVARPLRVRSALLGHLVVRKRIVSGVLLARRRGAAFDVDDRRALTRLLPALAVADALQQALDANTVRGPVVALECVDQRLTPRQREIVVQVALGQTNAEVGRALGISEHTVRNLLAQVRARLGAANRAEVVRLAVLR